MSDVISGAASGAVLGSVIPGVGTVAGAIVGGALGFLGDIFGGTGQVAHAQAKADVSAYQTYLNQFPTYAAAKKEQYQAQEQQTLSDRLAAMDMHGIQTGGEGKATSAASVYTTEKSLWDTDYTQLVQSLNLEKTQAENQLEVAQETGYHTGGLFGHGGLFGTGVGA